MHRESRSLFMNICYFLSFPFKNKKRTDNPKNVIC